MVFVVGRRELLVVGDQVIKIVARYVKKFGLHDLKKKS